MPTNTPNYNLVKPTKATDTADIDVINANMDKIDTAMKATADAVSVHETDSVKHITAAERTAWNAKETPSGAQAKVDAAITALINGAPGALNTLAELAAAIGNDASFATTMASALATKLNATASLIDSAAGNMRPAYNLTNVDFNTVTVSGFYHVNTAASNFPVAYNGVLEVYAISDTNYVIQIYTTWNRQKFFRTKEAGTWGSWVNLRDADTVDGLQGADIFARRNGLPANQNWNNLTDPGSYSFGGVSGMTNHPGFEWGTVHVFRDSGNYVTQVAIQQVGVNYGFKYRTRNESGGWSQWTTIWNSGNDGAGSGLDADTLHGWYIDVNPTALRIVGRDGNGWVRASAFYVHHPSNSNKWTVLEYENTLDVGRVTAVHDGISYKPLVLNGSDLQYQHNGGTRYQVWNALNNGPGKYIPIFEAETYIQGNGGVLSGTLQTGYTTASGQSGFAQDRPTRIDPEMISGRSVYLDVVMRSTNGIACNVALAVSSNSSVAGMSTTSGSFVRIRSSAISHANISGIDVYLGPISTNAQIKSARLIIL